MGTAGAVLAGRRRRGRPAVSAAGPMDRQRRRLFWPFVLPALVVYLVFFIGPTIASVYISFHSWDGVGELEPRGIENYRVLLEDGTFRTAFVNTLLILGGVGLAVFVVSFALTTVIREMRGRRFVRSVIFFPNIVAPIVLSVLWGFIFRSEGLVDSAVRGATGEPGPNWLGDHLLLVILIGILWVNAGFYTTIIMAGVDRIPKYYYEDCELSGANAFQRLRYVTLPLNWDVIATAAVIWTIASLKIFEFIYAFGGTTNDMPPVETWNSALFVYGTTFGGRTPAFQFGYASAAAVVTLFVVIVLVLLLRRLMRREAVQF